jgi:hypothetical protein
MYPIEMDIDTNGTMATITSAWYTNAWRWLSKRVETCCDWHRYNKTNVDTIESILFYFDVVTDLNPYSRDTQQDPYDKSNVDLL